MVHGTLVLNSKMNIITKFQVPIFKNDEVKGGSYFNPLLRRISWLQGLRGIGLNSWFLVNGLGNIFIH